MELVLSRLPVKLSKTMESTKTAENKRCLLAQEVNACLADMRRNEQLFNLESDDDMIDAYIYEREALLCRYRAILRQVKLAR